MRVLPRLPKRDRESVPGTGPLSGKDPVMEVGPLHFLPSKNCFVAKNLTTFFAKSLFDINMVLLRLITFLLSQSTEMKLFTSLCVRLWDHHNGLRN